MPAMFPAANDQVAACCLRRWQQWSTEARPGRRPWRPASRVQPIRPVTSAARRCRHGWSRPCWRASSRQPECSSRWRPESSASGGLPAHFIAYFALTVQGLAAACCLVEQHCFLCSSEHVCVPGREREVESERRQADMQQHIEQRAHAEAIRQAGLVRMYESQISSLELQAHARAVQADNDFARREQELDERCACC